MIDITASRAACHGDHAAKNSVVAGLRRPRSPDDTLITA
jgi:hypothetical protein